MTKVVRILLISLFGCLPVFSQNLPGEEANEQEVAILEEIQNVEEEDNITLQEDKEEEEITEEAVG